MAICLEIFPVLIEKISNPILGNIYERDRLRFISNSFIIPLIIDPNTYEPRIEMNLLPPKIKLKFHNGGRLVTTRKDRNGQVLKYTHAKYLKELPIPANTHVFDKAIMAYIKALPDETEIILYWS